MKLSYHFLCYLYHYRFIPVLLLSLHVLTPLYKIGNNKIMISLIISTYTIQKYTLVILLYFFFICLSLYSQIHTCIYLYSRIFHEEISSNILSSKYIIKLSFYVILELLFYFVCLYIDGYIHLFW